MNNIKQKNIIMGLNGTDNIPYSIHDVRHSNNKSIDAITMNNSFNQLVDNDLYIEKYLTNLSSYQYGPKTYDSTVSQTQDDGTKYWTGMGLDEQPQILHKINKPLSTTFSNDTYTDNSKIQTTVNYVAQYSNILFSGIGSSASNGKIIYRRVTDQKWSVYENKQSYTYFLNGGFFIIGSNKDILLLKTDDDSFSFLKINSEEFDGYPTAINIDSNNNIYVGTNNGKIYYGKIPSNKDDLETTKIQFILTQTAGIGRVNDIDFREHDEFIDDSNYILVTCQNGLYKSGYAKELLNRQDRDVEATNIIDTIEIWNENYIVSEDGIYLVNNNGTQEKTYTNSNLKAATVYSGNIYVLKQEDKTINILTISDTFTHTSFLNFNVDTGENCQKIKLFETDKEKIVLIGTDKHLRCIVKSKTDSTIINDKIEFDGTNIVNVSLLEIQNIGELFRVFVTVSKASSKNFYIYNIYQQDRKYIHLEETANFGGVIKDKDIDNNNNNHFYNFANRQVYVDGRYLKSLDGVIKIDLQNTNVTILNRTERKYFSDAGLIVKIGNEIKFINESLRVINKIIIPSDITVSNIEGIVTGLDNVYILEKNKIHICSVTSTKKYKVDEEYTFNKLGVFNSPSNVINGGFIINDDFVILSSNTLAEMNTNIDDKQSKMIFNILTDASSGATTPLIPKLIAKNPSMYNSYPVVNGNNIEILTYNNYPQVFNKEQVFPFTNVQNIVNFNEYVIVNYNNKLSALQYDVSLSAYNGYTINGIDGSVNSLMNIGNTIIYGNGTDNMFATSKLSNMSDQITGFANIDFNYDFDIYRKDDEDKIFDFIGLSANKKIVSINKDIEEKTTTIKTMYSFGSDESNYIYKTLIDEREQFISLSSEVTFLSSGISTGLSTNSNTGDSITISVDIEVEAISSRYKTFVNQNYTNSIKEITNIYFSDMYPTYTDNVLMKTPNNDVYILSGNGYQMYNDAEDGNILIANNLSAGKIYNSGRNIINIDTYNKSRELNKKSSSSDYLKISSDVDVFIIDKQDDGDVLVEQKSLNIIEGQANSIDSDINVLDDYINFNPAQIRQINDNTTITIKPITGETILKVLVYNITESNIITFFVLCKDSSNEKTLYRCNSNSSNVIQITENNKILNGNYFIDIVKNQKTQQIYKVREISNEAILYPIDTVQQIPLSVNWDDINEVKLLKQKTVLLVPQMSSNIINVNTILLNVQESDMLQNYSNLQSGQIYYKDMFVNDGILYAIKNDGTLQYAKYWDLFSYGFQIYLTDVKIDGNKINVSNAIPGSVIDNGHIIYVSKPGNNTELFQITYDKNNDRYTSTNIQTDVRNYLISLTNTPLQDIFDSKTEFAMSDGNEMYHIYESNYTLKPNSTNINNIVNFVQDDLNNIYVLKNSSGDKRQIHKLIKNYATYSTILQKDGLSNSAQLIHSNKQFGFTDGTYYIIGDNSFSKTGSIDNICGFYIINENKFNAISNNKLFKSFTDVIPYIQYQKVIQSDLNISQMQLIDSNLIPLVVSKGGKKEFYDLDMNTYSFFINKYDGQTDFDYAILIKDGEKVIKISYISGGKLFYTDNNEILTKWFLDSTNEIRLAYGFYNDSNYTLITDDKKIITFTGYDEHIRKFVNKANTGISRNLIKTGFNEFIFNTNKGVYYIKKDSVIKITYDYNIESLNEITLDGSIKYVYSIGNTVYSTNNYRKINDKQDILLVLPELITSIYDVQKINNYAYEFATNRGLFSTIYDYELINDLTYYKSDDIYKIYKNLLSTDISGEIEQVISNHIELMHNPDSLIPKINENIIDTNFENINESWFQNNDMIQQVIFGKQDDVGLSVFTENFITNDQPKINYIVKKYTSGVTEIYILVDTTNTYYINHLNGAGFSKPSTNSYQRLNLEKFGTQVSFLEYDENMINTYKTKLSVVLDESIYHIDEGIIDCQINGCSLPLDIYMDIDGGFDNSTASISSMYQSLVVPSQVAKVDGNIIQFNCFGTDQQSIRISYR